MPKIPNKTVEQYIMNIKLQGYFAGITAAIAYGTNPLGALFLYKEGFNPASVIFYRFIFAVAILAVILLIQTESFKITKLEFKVLSSLGAIFSASALTLYSSFNYMDSGIASTILFSYPVMVAVIMAVFFKEKSSFVVIASIALSILGIVLLYQGEGGIKLSTIGVILVLLSSLTYAVYIVIVNRTRINMNPFKMTFYIMLIAAICVFMFSLFNPANNIIKIQTISSLCWLLFLGVVPTIIAMTFLNIAIPKIGSTPTAIVGALEPVTAVVISIFVFEGSLTLRLLVGIGLVLLSVILITLKDLPKLRKQIKLRKNMPLK